MTYAIEAEGLRKRFGSTQALAGVDLAAREGTVLGVLGPNGAGKTTAVRVLATLLRADSGRARVGGFDVVSQAHEVRRTIGLTGQYASVDEDLTGTQNLVMIGQLLNLSTGDARTRARELLTWFDLADAAGKQAKTYSGGMRRRLDLAASLVGRPAVIFLDEPTTGLDPAKREDMWDVIRSLVDEGSTVLLTTQYLEEADALADEISVIDHGQVIAHDTPDGLKRTIGGSRIEVRPTDPDQLAAVATVLTEVGQGAPEVTGRNRLSVPVAGEEALPVVVQRLAAEGIALTELSLHLPSLDEVFLTLTGHQTSTDSEEDGRIMAQLLTPSRSSNPRPALSAAAPTDSRSTAGTYLRHAVVLARRSLIKTWRTPEALIDVTIQPIIFLALFTYIFGGAIASGDRGAYLQFLLPGILGQSIALAGIALGTNLNSDIDKGVFDRFRSLPIARSAPLVGAVLADLARYAILCVVTLSTGFLMGFRVHTSWLSALAAVGLAIGFALCFCWISVFIGMKARTPGSVQAIGFLMVLPLSFGSNTFVSTDTMPGWLQAFVKVNPISHLVSTVRALMNGGAYGTDLVWTLGWMAVLLVVFVPLALRAYRARA